jgi:hypothetical protein
LVQNQGGREYQTGGIHQYFEDLIFAANTALGPISLRSASIARPEDLFEMGFRSAHPAHKKRACEMSRKPF